MDKNILIVVCHPDDEALWIGGLIHAISMINNFSVNVICLNGAGSKEASIREIEFYKCQKIAGYRRGIVLEGDLKSALTKIENLEEKIEFGLKEINLQKKDINLVITHSPYGDEHRHPQHIQCSKELYKICKKNKIEYGYFSRIPLPNIKHIPYLKTPKRLNELQALNFSKCKSGFLGNLMRLLNIKPYWYPKYYCQWLVSKEIKEKMMMSYKSTGLESFKSGYASFNNFTESLYLDSKKGIKILENILNVMDTPNGWSDIFISYKMIYIKKKFKKLFSL